MPEIRTLTRGDDLAAVGGLYAESWRAAYRGLLPAAFLERLTGDRWSAVLSAERDNSLILLDDGALAGTAMVGFSREPGREGYGELVSLYLRPGCEGRGYGRGLLEAALQRLADEGCERVCLWVLAGNRNAIGFYRHMGFQPTGRTQQERYGEAEACLIEMARDLAR